MGFLLLALFIVWLLAELAALSWVSDLLGSTFDGLALVLLLSLVGAWLTKRAGLGAARRIRQAANEGKTPSAELADGVLILAAGVLLIVPGFVSGAMGAALLVPPVRVGVRRLFLKRLERRSRVVVTRPQSGVASEGTGGIWDVDSWEGSPDDSGPDDTGPAELGGSR
jgi:UPF0716 protein FxsA